MTQTPDPDPGPLSSGGAMRLLSQTATRRDGLAHRRTPRNIPARGSIIRRSWTITIAKRLLPVVALALLTIVAMWPEISRDATMARMALHVGLADPESGQLTQARYNGVDQQGRRYTVTADTARQVSPERVNLTAPVGDLTLGSGTWLYARGHTGVYLQLSQQLDLAGDVVLYRDDGITLATDAVSMDLKAGIAASSARVHVEGPFGTLDAQGFALLDRGSTIQFTGPGRLVLNGHSE
jgi:lipopolysaccharide export system protein LptC